MFWQTGWWWTVSMYRVLIWWYFVTGYSGWCSIHENVIHSLGIVSSFVSLWKMIIVCVDRSACIIVHACAFTPLSSPERTSCLEGDELMSRREGGTGSVMALLASLSSGRRWEWLADPLLTLVRWRNPSSWLKCHWTADHWLIVECHIILFSLF